MDLNSVIYVLIYKINKFNYISTYLSVCLSIVCIYTTGNMFTDSNFKFNARNNYIIVFANNI